MAVGIFDKKIADLALGILRHPYRGEIVARLGTAVKATRIGGNIRVTPDFLGIHGEAVSIPRSTANLIVLACSSRRQCLDNLVFGLERIVRGTAPIHRPLRPGIGL